MATLSLTGRAVTSPPFSFSPLQWNPTLAASSARMDPGQCGLDPGHCGLDPGQCSLEQKPLESCHFRTTLLCRYSKAVLDLYFGGSEVQLSVVPGETLPHSSGGITNPVTPVSTTASTPPPPPPHCPPFHFVLPPSLPPPRPTWSQHSVTSSPALTWDWTMPTSMCRPSLRQTWS